MRRYLGMVVSCSLFLFPLMVSAQTPDGETPAEESVCDPLKADGVTKALYGLCIAFCEAQDHASPDNPINAGELTFLEGEAPSGRILANYNRLKKATDPDMPCIVVEQNACPCWTLDELQAVQIRPDCRYIPFFLCDLYVAEGECFSATPSTNCYSLNNPSQAIVDAYCQQFPFNCPPNPSACDFNTTNEVRAQVASGTLAFENPTCLFVPDAGVVRRFSVSDAEFDICAQQIVDRGQVGGWECFQP